MPKVRRAKKNTSKAAQAPAAAATAALPPKSPAPQDPPPSETTASEKAAVAVAVPPPKKRLLKPACKGASEVHFGSSERDWEGEYYRLIGTSTTTVSFGSQFQLTDEHIEDILVLAVQVRKKIANFIFKYSDVSYDAKNDAKGLTNAGVIRLAEGLPNLKQVMLPSASNVTDDGLIGLLKNCPKLTTVEVSGHSGYHATFSDKAMTKLQENPHWAPKLKSLIIGETDSNKEFMKAMRACTKERDKLVVTLITRSEVKKWGDWELESIAHDYKKGRKFESGWKGKANEMTQFADDWRWSRW